MGLRFRKSVTLCKGVKLNFGKTGMSVASDLFALLPVRYVIVYAQSGEKSILEAKFDKSVLQGIDFKVEKAGDIIKKFML